MLILTRKIGQEIKIDEAIVITVVGMKRRQVRLRITAPCNISIYREEIYHQHQQAKKN